MRTLVIILALFFVTDFVNAQYDHVGSPIISHFKKSDYRAGSQNWVAIQDERGIMYFGNNQGILEFDGTTWHTFSLPNSTIVRSMTFDGQGRLCVGGQDEIGFLSSDESGTVFYESLSHLVPETLRNFEDIWKIFSLGDQVLFCSQKVIFQLHDQDLNALLPPSRFINFFKSNETIFVQDAENGLLKWTEESFVPVPGGTEFIGSRITAILPYSDKQSVLVSAGKGLFLMSAQGIHPWKVEASEVLKSMQTYSAIQMNDGGFAIGTEQDGILILDRHGRAEMQIDSRNGLQNNTVLSIFQDKHHNLWLCLDSGIDYVEISAPFSIISDPVGLKGTGYASVIHEDRLYLGTNQGLYFIDRPDDQDLLQKKKFQPVQNLSGQVWTLEILDGELMAGLHEGAFIIDGDKASVLSDTEGAWKFIQLIEDENYAIEGTYSGLLLYHKKGKINGPSRTKWEYVGKLDGFDESARVIEQDGSGHIWVSHAYRGLYKIRIDLEQNKIESVSFYDSRHGLPMDISLNVSRVRGQLVFTTPRGIYYYDEMNDVFKPQDELNAVFGKESKIQRLIEDENGNHWFSVNGEFGTLKVLEQVFSIEVDKVYFNQIQEKLRAGFEHVYAHDDQNVFIATDKGFIHYNPSRIKDFQLPYKTLIRSVNLMMDRDSVIYGGGAPGVPKQEGHLEDFCFPHRINDFKFSFSTPFYEHINHVQYRYRLEGFNENWSDWGSLTQKEYTNLPHGEYRFQVEAKNAYAKTSSSDNFSFVIEPPWTETGWGRVVMFLLAFILLFGFYRYMHNRMKKEQHELKERQAVELQQKEDEFKQEAKKSEAEIIRLRNEKLMSEIDHKNRELASATMHLVQKGEMLNKIKQELNKLLPSAFPENREQVKKLIRTIVADARLDDNWEKFEHHYDQVHEDFLKRIREKYTSLTPKDQKLCAYLRMNLSTKEIAPLMNISVRGVEISRYRLRKKLGLQSDTNLVEFLINF